MSPPVCLFTHLAPIPPAPVRAGGGVQFRFGKECPTHDFHQLAFLHLLCWEAQAAGSGGLARGGRAGSVGGRVRWLTPARAETGAGCTPKARFAVL